MSPHDAAAEQADEIVATEPASVYTSEQASLSLARATRLVVLITVIAMPVAWLLQGWQSAVLLLVGAAISASGLWEWKRLMAALMARMDAHDLVQATSDLESSHRPSIAFAVAGFVVRLSVVLVVLYVSLRYLHGSVVALAAGLALGVVALTVEGLRLLRSGTI